VAGRYIHFSKYQKCISCKTQSREAKKFKYFFKIKIGLLEVGMLICRYRELV